jgi:protein-S-isoprenylcysteine O-methyltransferase
MPSSPLTQSQSFRDGFVATTLIVVGLVVTVAAQALRTWSMHHCGKNFAHLVATVKEEKHELVTSGPYAIARHPAYTGFFWFTVAAQLYLLNPVCVCAWTFASYRFFQDRIPREERALRRFFPDAYDAYAKSTPTLIPFIR